METRSNMVVLFLSLIFLGMMIIPSIKANMIVMWNDTQANIPSGWTCDSCTGLPIMDFYQGLPRLSSTFCGFDGDFYCYGSSTHTHTISTATNRPNIYVYPLDLGNSFNSASKNHIHTSVNSTLTTANNSIPLSWSLLYIIWNSTNSPQQLVKGMIVFFNSTTAPTNFSLYTAGDGLFPYGNDTAQGILGADTHIHTNKTLKTSSPSGVTACSTGLKANVATVTHFHELGSIGWDNQSDVPLYVNMTPIIVTSNTSIPVGMVGMFNATPTGNWSIWNSNLGYYVRMSTTTFNVTGGNANHNHTAQNNILSGAGSAGLNCLFGSGNHSSSSHTHNVNLSVSTVANSPSATNTIFAISNGSQELTTTTCTWSGIGNWLIDCSENCVLSSTQNLMRNAIIYSNSGLISILADIFNFSYSKQPVNCDVKTTQGKRYG